MWIKDKIISGWDQAKIQNNGQDQEKIATWERALPPHMKDGLLTDQNVQKMQIFAILEAYVSSSLKMEFRSHSIDLSEE